jgi:hypothetical protein
MGGACSTHRRDEKLIKIFVVKPEGKRALGRPMCRWEDNIKMNYTEIGRGGVGWSHLAQDRVQWRDLVSTAIDLRVP